jgi:phospholipase A
MIFKPRIKIKIIAKGNPASGLKISGKKNIQSKINIIHPNVDKQLKLYLSLNLSKNIVIVYKKVKGETTMATTQKQFDNEMKALSIGVYKGNEKSIPKDWIKVSEYDKKSGFHGEAFYKDGKVVIAMRGTDEFVNDFIKEDIRHLAKKKLPNQYVDAQKFYEKVRKDFPDQEIIFTGHSLGGSLAQLMSNKTGHEAVTFNAYGVRNILQGYVRDNLENIRNYGNINDTVFNNNIDNQLGSTYVIKKNYDKASITKGAEGYLGGLDPYFHHKAEWMGDLEDAVEYKPNRLEGRVNMNIDFKDIDTNRVFTNEEIGQMSPDEFSRLENFINQQIAEGKVMPEAQAKQQVQTGDLIYVNSYTRSDGTEVKGYYRSKPSI